MTTPNQQPDKNPADATWRSTAPEWQRRRLDLLNDARETVRTILTLPGFTTQPNPLGAAETRNQICQHILKLAMEDKWDRYNEVGELFESLEHGMARGWITPQVFEAAERFVTDNEPR